MRQEEGCDQLSFDQVKVEVEEEEMSDMSGMSEVSLSIAEESKENETIQMDETEKGVMPSTRPISPFRCANQPSRIVSRHSRFVSAVQSELEQLKDMKLSKTARPTSKSPAGKKVISQFLQRQMRDTEWREERNRMRRDEQQSKSPVTYVAAPQVTEQIGERMHQNQRRQFVKSIHSKYKTSRNDNEIQNLASDRINTQEELVDCQMYQKLVDKFPEFKMIKRTGGKKMKREEMELIYKQQMEKKKLTELKIQQARMERYHKDEIEYQQLQEKYHSAFIHEDDVWRITERFENYGRKKEEKLQKR